MVSILNQRNKPPHYIVFWVEKKLPYDLVCSPQNLVYNVDDYTKSQSRLLDFKAAICAQQYRRSSLVILKDSSIREKFKIIS